MTMRSSSMILLALLLAGGVAAAGSIPQEGQVDSSVCFGGPMHVIAPSATEQFGSYVVKGATSAADVAFDSLVVECTGTFERRAGTTQSKGHCIFRDADGDAIYGTDAITPEGYVWTYVSGTGKFQGITGSGRLERWGTLEPTSTELRGCRKFTGTYRVR